MNDISSIVVACCGFGVVCCGSVTLVLFMVARRTGLALLMPAANLISNMLFSDNKNDEDKYKGQAASRSSSFRDRLNAQSSSFQAPQQSQSRLGQQAASSQRRRLQPPPLSNDPFADSDSSFGQQTDDPFGVPGLRGGSARTGGRDTRKGTADARDEEIFGGFLDDEGDGFPDF